MQNNLHHRLQKTLAMLWKWLSRFVGLFRTKPQRTFQRGSGRCGIVHSWDGHILEVLNGGTEPERWRVVEVKGSGDQLILSPIEN